MNKDLNKIYENIVTEKTDNYNPPMDQEELIHWAEEFDIPITDVENIFAEYGWSDFFEGLEKFAEEQKQRKIDNEPILYQSSGLYEIKFTIKTNKKMNEDELQNYTQDLLKEVTETDYVMVKEFAMWH